MDSGGMPKDWTSIRGTDMEIIEAWLTTNAPRLPALTYKESQLYCCQSTLQLERERLHHLVRKYND